MDVSLGRLLQTVCRSGYYGDACDLPCGHCLNNTCDRSNGTCLGECSPGYYGDACNGWCKGHCLNNTCDRVDGSCLHACDLGYYGETCNLQCKGHCLGNTCDRVKGTCPQACKAGYYGDACDLQCKGYCQDNTCDRVSGTCLGGSCAAGYFGKDCMHKCGQCTSASSCDTEIGHCTTGCLFGWKGDFCNVSTHECACADPADGGCEKVPGISPDGVENKANVAFGKKASMSSRYKDGQGLSAPACAAVNGRTMTNYRTLNQSQPNCVHTKDGDRSPWWKVDLDRAYTVTGVTIYRRADYHKSSYRMAGARVWVDDTLCYTFPTSNLTDRLYPLHHKLSVTCTRPVRGQVVTFSKDGDDTSHHFYPINICEFQVWVCKDGFYGDYCNETCDNCPHRLCDNYDGTCLKEGGGIPSGCRPYQYGADCSKPCGRCAGHDNCDHLTGHCPGDCLHAGLLPPLCQQPCLNGTFGRQCKEKCGQCKDSAPCDAISGHCHECKESFVLPLCTVKSRGHPDDSHGYHLHTGVLAGSIAGGLALIALNVLILGICHCRRQRYKHQSATTESGELEEGHAAPPPYYHNPAFDGTVTQGEGNGEYVIPQNSVGQGEQLHAASTNPDVDSYGSLVLDDTKKQSYT